MKTETRKKYSVKLFNIGGNIENRIGRTSYGNLRRYIFAALIAKTDIDFLALDKGEISLREAVDKMMEKMEEYANYGFDYIEDKLANAPNYYFSDIAFLTEITNMLVRPKTEEKRIILIMRCLNRSAKYNRI